MVLQLKTVGLPTSGTKKTRKQRVKSRRDPSSQNLGNYLLRLQAGVSSREVSIGVCVEFVGPSEYSPLHRDEGFHLLHIGAWDNALSLEILKDWVNLVDEDGWVGREQILGEEARSRVSIFIVVLVPPPDVRLVGTERIPSPSPNLRQSTHSRHGCHRFY